MSKKPLARLDTVNGMELLFDERPIEIGKFLLGARSAKPIGRPSLEGWSAALEFACASNEGSPYWIGDLLAYSEGREDWKAKRDQVMNVSGLALQTLKNLGYIARHVEEPERRLAPTPAHAAEVASLERPDQTHWLQAARTEGWSVRELRLEMRAARRRRVLEGQASLEGLYRVLMVDYPWLYNDRPPSGSGAQQHYPGLPLEEGLKLPVAEHALPNSVLGFWVTAPILYDRQDKDDDPTPDALRLIDAWGFEPKTQIIWDKGQHGWGNYVSVQHEIFIIATRGSCTPDRPTPMIPSVYREKPDPVHSKKPAWFRKTMERLYDGPYLELFGREPVEGWRVFGNDARLWGAEAAAIAV